MEGEKLLCKSFKVVAKTGHGKTVLNVQGKGMDKSPASLFSLAVYT